MAIDYSKGGYVLYGPLPDKPCIGWAAHCFAFLGIDNWHYWFDGDEVYGLDGALVGRIEAGVASTKVGEFLFIIEPAA